MIPIRNIYYMLSYAYQILNERDMREMDLESFDNVQQLCAEILIKGISVQIKRGLKRDYILRSEQLSSVKGKIDVTDSLKTMSVLRRKQVCNYDELTINSPLNSILKTTMIILLRGNITSIQKKEIRKLLVYFSEVKELNVHLIDWNVHYTRTDQSYQLLISICYLVIKGLLLTQSDGTFKMKDFFDEQSMNRLYEKFILEYYRKHYPQLSPSPSFIEWQLDQQGDSMLPMMKTDIMLTHKNHVVIIDAKYYSHNTQEQFGKHTIHSNNLYQIFTYVKNKDYEMKGSTHTVSGMLLYARTDEEIQPDNDYYMSGNLISIRNLDLNTEFDNMSDILNEIAESLQNSN